MAVAGRDGRQSLSVIWERDLGKLIHESPGAGAHHHAVFELKISDDDRWIGVDVVADRTTMWEGQHHHLLLLPLNSINNAFEQYEFQQSRGSEEDFFSLWRRRSRVDSGRSSNSLGGPQTALLVLSVSR